MAKITLAFDTVSKVLDVNIDGKAVENCQGVNIYPSWEDDDKYRCVIQTRTEDKETDIETWTNIIASKEVFFEKVKSVGQGLATLFVKG